MEIRHLSKKKADSDFKYGEFGKFKNSIFCNGDHRG
jgi:hypothetical protein